MILVLTDEPSLTEMLNLIIDSSTSLVNQTRSSREAIVITQRQNPELILVDDSVNMDNKSDITRRFRNVSTAPIIFFSTEKNPTLIAQVLDSGADDYLTKPVSSNMLAACLNKYIRRSGLHIRIRAPSAS